MNVYSFEATEDVVTAYADHIIALAALNIADHGLFNIVLSGGGSPKKVYTLLSSSQYRSQINWKRVHFFFGDERYVPSDHPDANARMADETLMQSLNISDDQIFRVDTSLEPAAAAKDYERQIASHFDDKEIRFDLCMLGLGTDGHTASLFPHTDILAETMAGVRSVYLADKEVFRISMTAPLINQSKQISFLVFGEDKASAVSEVLTGRRNSDHYPAQLIDPLDGELEWFIDSDAGSKLSPGE